MKYFKIYLTFSVLFLTLFAIAQTVKPSSVNALGDMYVERDFAPSRETGTFYVSVKVDTPEPIFPSTCSKRISTLNDVRCAQLICSFY